MRLSFADILRVGSAGLRTRPLRVFLSASVINFSSVLAASLVALAPVARAAAAAWRSGC